MSDDASAPAGGATAAGAGGRRGGGGGGGGGGGRGGGGRGGAGGGEHAVDPLNGSPEKKSDVSSHQRKPSAFDVHVAGLAGNSNPSSQRVSEDTLDFDDYFVGPRDLDKHSKLPYFLRMHGSVLPRMMLPLLAVGAWATLITCISKYSEGRKTWSTLLIQSRNLARYIWIHVEERDGEPGTDDLLQKISAINLIHAYAVALKHRLRFEPYAHYPDLAGLVSHLDTYAKAAHKDEHLVSQKKSPWKSLGEHLGLPFAMSNPRKEMKRSASPLGNLPMEIMAYLSAYFETVANNGQMKSAVMAGQVMNALAGMTDTAGNAERVLTTPLPIGYNILISQVVLLYVWLLPFQLFPQLQWVTIPGTIAAAYIILGIATIGDELENPFGNDVNDLPLDAYCAELSRELDTLMSAPSLQYSIHNNDMGSNKPLWPLSDASYEELKGKTRGDIFGALRAKVVVGKRGHGLI
ncbi:UPF0187 domain membrane protein [Diplocarpon rosae]|nr:UPF0187 domain membrane protein [Diplocarpon rosae]